MLLSARRVAPTGKAYGLDMTDEMLALARENQRNGTIEASPLPDESVDVVFPTLSFPGRSRSQAARSSAGVASRFHY